MTGPTYQLIFQKTYLRIRNAFHSYWEAGCAPFKNDPRPHLLKSLTCAMECYVFETPNDRFKPASLLTLPKILRILQKTQATLCVELR